VVSVQSSFVGVKNAKSECSIFTLGGVLIDSREDITTLSLSMNSKLSEEMETNSERT
jgi:hypothetical protein